MESRRTGSSKWVVPAVALALGGAIFTAAWVGGKPGLGTAMLAIMAAYAALLLLLGGRSDVVGVMRGQPADERYRSFDLRATAFAATVLAVVIIGGFLYEMARGGDGEPYSLFGLVFLVSYVAALVWLRWRS